MKHWKNKKRMSKTTTWLLVVLFVIIFLNLAMAAVVWQMNKPKENAHHSEPTSPIGHTDASEPENTALPSVEEPITEPTVEKAAAPALELPYVLENGNLTLDAVFQLNGMNPDCDNAWAENVAGIQITNTSQKHLTSVKLFVTIDDGTVIEFAASDIPCGETGMVFALDNTSVRGQISCVGVMCEAVFEESTPLMENMVAVTVEGNTVTVANLTDQDLSKVTVCCHDVLDEICYGGLTYRYTIDVLPAGESTTFIAEDCILGQVKVVRITEGA